MDFMRISAIALLAASLSGAHAAPMQGGAYDDFFQPDVITCIGAADMAQMTAERWQKEMQKRAKTCQITQSDNPMPGLRRWSATCADAHSHSWVYSFTVNTSANGETLLIDSRITDAAGNLESKKAFQGKRQGACNAAATPFRLWDYFDTP